jgi:hypothetical protein
MSRLANRRASGSQFGSVKLQVGQHDRPCHFKCELLGVLYIQAALIPHPLAILTGMHASACHPYVMCCVPRAICQEPLLQDCNDLQGHSRKPLLLVDRQPEEVLCLRGERVGYVYTYIYQIVLVHC